MRQAFVFEGSSWKSSTGLALEYNKWVNNLLAEYPNANFEFHQSVGSFYSEKEESDWVQLYTLVIVSEQE